MKHLDPIITRFESNENNSIIMIHSLTPRVIVHVDIAIDTITVLIDNIVKSQSRVSSYSVEQYAQWLHDTYVSVAEIV